MNISKLFKDVLYVSKITGVKNKKVILILVVLLSQITAFSDVALIVIFTALLTGSYEESIISFFIEFVLDFKFIVPVLVIIRYFVTYAQSMILKKLEMTVTRNIKVQLLTEVFEKRNYSVADAYFYLNQLSGHIAFFYANITSFINSLLQGFAYILYLTYSNEIIFGTLAGGILILYYPARILILKSKEWMHKIYVYQQSSSHEIQRVVDNMFLIKILKKEEEEISKFATTLENLNKSDYKHIKFSSINGYLPSFMTLFIFSILLGIDFFLNIITIDFILVTLRLFQSIGVVSSSINRFVNSHVHISKLYDLMKNRNLVNKENFILSEEDSELALEVNNLTFRYFNSEIKLFKNLSFSIKSNTHTILTGANGSGKSTLLGLIAGVYYAQEGFVKSYKKKFGYIGATPLIFSGTLKENILYGNNADVNDDQILKSLKEFDTFKEKQSYDLYRQIDNKSLSSGQMQKIAFIRALLADVNILLLDESAANLDDKSRDFIFELLKNKKITIINSTHDPLQFRGVDHHININLVNEDRIIEIIK